jgi:alkylation response protein AidB-like acyl-CoA dehydrogenase
MSAVALADRPAAQMTFGRAHALVSASRNYLIQTLNDLWNRVRAGHAPGLADRGALWLAATHAAHSALEAIDTLYSMAGASAVYHGSPLDRCLRDARTAVQHVCTQRWNFELAGRRLLRPDDPAGIWGIDARGET